MAFWGCSFVFNGTSCDQYDLMIYDFGSSSQSDGYFASGVSIIEESISKKYKPLFYGTKFENKLEFELVFGVNQERINYGEYLTRQELESIASWLTGHKEYLWFEINQEDLSDIRYKCVVSSLDILDEGGYPWALRAKFVCDGPYAYHYPVELEYAISGSKTIELDNISGHNGYYSPILEIEFSGGDFTIINKSDNNREFSLSGVPSSITNIYVDNDKGILAESGGTNVYQYFNFNFLRLKKGVNTLSVNGTGTLKITCEFPANVGC